MQLDVLRPAVDPYKPAPQSVHDPAPLTLYEPSGHIDAVALVDPAAHAYPAWQGPVHTAVVNLGSDPYLPAGQSEQDPAPLKLYVPAKHLLKSETGDPVGQLYPAVHGPVQFNDVRPADDPYLPAAH